MLKCKLTTWQRHDLSYFYSMCSFWAPSDFSLLLVSNWKALITTNAKKAETYQKTNRKKLLYLSIAVPPGYRSDLSETWLQRSLNDASTKLSFLLFHFTSITFLETTYNLVNRLLLIHWTIFSFNKLAKTVYSNSIQINFIYIVPNHNSCSIL